MAGKFISKVSASSNGTQTLTLSSIPQNFKHLEIVFYGSYNYSYLYAGSFMMRINGSSSNDHWSSFVRSVRTNAGSFYGPTLTSYFDFAHYGGQGGTIRLFAPNYTSTARHKSIIGSGGALSGSDSWDYAGFVLGGTYGGTAITSISTTGDFGSGTSLALYGWK